MSCAPGCFSRLCCCCCRLIDSPGRPQRPERERGRSDASPRPAALLQLLCSLGLSPCHRHIVRDHRGPAVPYLRALRCHVSGFRLRFHFGFRVANHTRLPCNGLSRKTQFYCTVGNEQRAATGDGATVLLQDEASTLYDVLQLISPPTLVAANDSQRLHKLVKSQKLFHGPCFTQQ